MMFERQVSSDLASGAFPTQTFPCNHLASPKAQIEAPSWAPPEQRATASSLRKAVLEADWSALFAEGKTMCQMQPAWSASDDRCNALALMCSLIGAKRVLEIGAFCGAASLSMAEVLPADGEVMSLDIDPFPFREVGREFKEKSPHFKKVQFMVGEAIASLEKLEVKPFDLVVIDADKANLRSYFDFVWGKPGFLSEQAAICIDVTPFKGAPPDRYVRFGQSKRWTVNSGQEEIDAFKHFVEATPSLMCLELAGMLVVRRAAA